MADNDKTYRIERRFFDGTWREVTENFYGNYEDAANLASQAAHELDKKYSNDHFWTVDLKSAVTGGSYFQLFHGRLS